MASKTCGICCESFNLSTRSSIKCNNPDCEIEICKECIRTYLLGTPKDPHCMNCKTALNQEYLVANLNRSFCKKEYKTHRTEMLLDREMGKMPESMPAAEKQKAINEMRFNIEGIDKQIQIFSQAINDLRDKKGKYLTDIWRLETGKVKIGKKKFIMPCSVEDCRGFLSNAYKCEICEVYTCPDCLVPIGKNRTNGEHVCDEKTKENAEFIKSTCKACPGMCGEFIYKIDGCDQMWCTTCHTAFSWKTGEIERGVVHNPHYYAALQNGGGVMPRAPGDVVCGGLPDFYYEIDRPFKRIVRKLLIESNIDKFIPKKYEYHELSFPDQLHLLYNAMNGHFSEDKKINKSDENYLNHNITPINEYLKACIDVEVLYKEIMNIHRQMNHVTAITLPDERRKIESLRDNEQLRVEYILGDISKEKLAESVYRADIKRQKCQEELYIWELLSSCSIDLFRDIAMKMTSFDIQNKETMIETIIELISYINVKLTEFKKLTLYCNTEFKKIGITYALVVPFIAQTSTCIIDIKDRGILRIRGNTDGTSIIAANHLSNPQLYINMLNYLNKIVSKQASSIEYYATYNRMLLSTEKWTNKDKKKSVENKHIGQGPIFDIRTPVIIS